MTFGEVIVVLSDVGQSSRSRFDNSWIRRSVRRRYLSVGLGLEPKKITQYDGEFGFDNSRRNRRRLFLHSGRWIWLTSTLRSDNELTNQYVRLFVQHARRTEPGVELPSASSAPNKRPASWGILRSNAVIDSQSVSMAFRRVDTSTSTGPARALPSGRVSWMDGEESGARLRRSTARDFLPKPN